MVGTQKQAITWLLEQDNTKQYEVKEHKQKRSKSQNAYMWEIITQIADIQRLSKEEVYLQILKDYGQSEIISMLSIINPKGYLKYFEEIGKGQVNGKEFTHYKVYKGSSEYDSKEMSILIDGVIQEATQLHIPTLTPKQVAEMRII